MSLGLVRFEYRPPGAAQPVAMPVPSGERITLSSRDDYRLYVEPAERCYLYLYQVDSRGTISQLFPNAGWSPHLSNPVDAGKSYLMPSDSTWFYLDNTPSTETIYVVAARKPMSDLDALFHQAGQSQAAAARLTEGLAALARGSREGVAGAAFTFDHRPAPWAASSPLGAPASYGRRAARGGGAGE
jgi:hypothetical protein